jgi:hypothetical protein
VSNLFTLALILLPFAVSLILLLLLGRNIARGNVSIAGRKLGSRQNPLGYWSTILGQTAMLGFAAFVAYKFMINGSSCPIFAASCDYGVTISEAP